MELKKLTTMHKLNIEKTDKAQPHYLYDMSLPLPERHQKRMFFTSGSAAANFLGVPVQRIYVARSNHHRIYSEAQGGWFAVRLAKAKKELV